MASRVGITYRNEEKLEPYAAAVKYAGLDPAPLRASGPYSLDGLDGLLLAGGADVNPELYHQTRHEENESPDDERDGMEMELLAQALDQDMPVLAICRGMQLFNVFHRGDLIQNLDNAVRHRQRGVTDVHPVTVIAGTRLARIVGTAAFAVNSRHHQAAGTIGRGLVVSARSDDGVVEGLERPDRRFALGVQWHPEDRVPSHEPDTRLFEAFALALNR
ncbi:MAG: gamma-glutamyl-gamma-aminobutyrate hydrolase family protein [Acidobacteria bacterium]|nr:gamma-glutamyl-gamma-aminobutyrate hydrolase family protein [Acidobacteriota bacterium]